MEKYGTIPPKFTKDWWAHYWTYYKLHFFFGLFIAFAVGILIHSCVTQIHYDLQVQYAAYSAQPPADTLANFDDLIFSLCEDVTGNGKVETNTSVTVTPLADSSPDAVQYEYAVLTKFMAQIQASENQIYIVDKAFAEKLIAYECMLPVSEWADEVSDDLVLQNSLISLSQNSKLSKLGFDTENLYMGVLNLQQSQMDDDEYVAKFENAKNIAHQLIKE